MGTVSKGAGLFYVGRKGTGTFELTGSSVFTLNNSSSSSTYDGFNVGDINGGTSATGTVTIGTGTDNPTLSVVGGTFVGKRRMDASRQRHWRKRNRNRQSRGLSIIWRAVP